VCKERNGEVINTLRNNLEKSSSYSYEQHSE
jgi:hypothetical protein